MKKFFPALLSAAIALLHATSIYAADIVETASSSGTFKTFLAATQAAGFTQTLKNTGPYTVFAPTDEAFKKLPAGTVSALMKDKVKLAQFIAHHVIPGKITVAEIKPGKTKTLQGDLLALSSDNGKVTVDNANVLQSDLLADNGVIHEIDTVALPE